MYIPPGSQGSCQTLSMVTRVCPVLNVRHTEAAQVRMSDSVKLFHLNTLPNRRTNLQKIASGAPSDEVVSRSLHEPELSASAIHQEHRIKVLFRCVARSCPSSVKWCSSLAQSQFSIARHGYGTRCGKKNIAPRAEWHHLANDPRSCRTWELAPQILRSPAEQVASSKMQGCCFEVCCTPGTS